MNKLPVWRVRFNAHRYEDCSDTPQSRSRRVHAASAEEAVALVMDERNRNNKIGNWYIGLVHSAEPVIVERGL